VWSPQSDAMDRNCCSLLVRVGTRDHWLPIDMTVTTY
jgi:hypothetical protein